MIDDSTGVLYCDATTHQLEPQYTVGGVQQTISKILSQADDGLFIFDDEWFEVYPQAFAFVQYVQGNETPSQYYKPTFDGVLNKGDLPCVQSWAAALVAGNFTPPVNAPASCTVTPPTWYTPGQ